MQQDGPSANYSMTMEPVDETKINGAEEIEKVEDDAANMKPTNDPFTAEDEKRLIRKLDFWYHITPFDQPQLVWPDSNSNFTGSSRS